MLIILYLFMLFVIIKLIIIIVINELNTFIKSKWEKWFLITANNYYYYYYKICKYLLNNNEIRINYMRFVNMSVMIIIFNEFKLIIF